MSQHKIEVLDMCNEKLSDIRNNLNDLNITGNNKQQKEVVLMYLDNVSMLIDQMNLDLTKSMILR